MIELGTKPKKELVGFCATCTHYKPRTMTQAGQTIVMTRGKCYHPSRDGKGLEKQRSNWCTKWAKAREARK